MTRAELIQNVALRMDEITPSAGLSVTVDGSDGNPLYTLIDGLIDGGALELFSVAQYWRLPQNEFDDIELATVGSLRKIIDNENGTSQTTGQRKIIRLKVPNDFLRVAEINHPSFQRPITEVFPEQTPEGRRQHNPFLMAKEARPVGVMSFDKWEVSAGVYETCREIDCYSLPTSASGVSTVTATYIPKPLTIYDDTDGVSPDNSVSVEDAVPEVLIPALEWLIAARTFGARGDSNHAAICQQNAQNLLV